MNIENAKVGMKVETENGEYTIDEIYKKMVRFKGWTHFLSAKDVEPINKFEVGDEVIWKNNRVEIWGKRYDEDLKDYEYAVVNPETFERQMVWENDLFPLKKKDELEVGDKFKDYSGNTVKVLARENNPVNITYYFGRTNSEKIDVWTYYDVREIIYD